MGRENAAGGGSVLGAGVLLAGVLGSLHAFSVLIAPFEQRFAAPRAEVSLTYSMALLAVTVAVLLGDRAYRALAPARLATAIGLLAASGLAVAALASHVWQLWLGYSLLFGLANGLGYGFSLHAAGQSNPGRAGRAMGLVTAAYALGAAVTPFALSSWLSSDAVPLALLLLAAAILAAASIAAVLLARSGFALRTVQGRGAPGETSRWPLMALLWVGYGTGAAAGLMAIGHASEIARSHGAQDSWALAAITLLSLANMGGSIAGGLAVDRYGVLPPLLGLPLLSAAGLVALAYLPGATAALFCLAIVGFAYGATIAAYPAAVTRLVGPLLAVRAYGVVFTAWGLAGLVAAWSAGLLFDVTGSYRASLLAAAAVALLSALSILGGRTVLRSSS